MARNNCEQMTGSKVKDYNWMKIQLEARVARNAASNGVARKASPLPLQNLVEKGIRDTLYRIAHSRYSE
jgi:hypothetical protein